MTRSYLRALMCVPILLAPATAFGRQKISQSKAITVNAGTASVEQWGARISHDLTAHLSYPTSIGRDDNLQGVIRISFRCGESGAPDRVTMIQSSRSSSLDRAALYAVKHIPTLHPLPDGVTHDRPMEAWVIFAQDQEAADKMKRGLERRAQLAGRSALPAGQQTASISPIIIASR